MKIVFALCLVMVSAAAVGCVMGDDAEIADDESAVDGGGWVPEEKSKTMPEDELIPGQGPSVPDFPDNDCPSGGTMTMSWCVLKGWYVECCWDKLYCDGTILNHECVRVFLPTDPGPSDGSGKLEEDEDLVPVTPICIPGGHEPLCGQEPEHHSPILPNPVPPHSKLGGDALIPTTPICGPGAPPPCPTWPEACPPGTNRGDDGSCHPIPNWPGPWPPVPPG